MRLRVAVLVPLCAGAAALSIPVDHKAAACAPVMLIHAPGTTQEGLDSVGEPLAAGLASAIPGLSALGLPYDTSAEYLVTPAQGAKIMADTIEGQLLACPDQRFILSGYSKGAMVVHLTSAALLTAEKARVCGVSVFGDPYDKDGVLGLLGLDDNWPITNPLVGGNIIEFCNENDIFCDGGLDVDAHLAYPTDGSVDQAVNFLVPLCS
ncbi:cutinase [Schizophyllum amplum]|uniref:Cutinase n=1 Tax=Schizophyllum amplum TaxID=97359 RepID=A0A550CN43_9AGAR|nr:cutinase [Auriculariopsis ampla]